MSGSGVRVVCFDQIVTCHQHKRAGSLHQLYDSVIHHDGSSSVELLHQLYMSIFKYVNQFDHVAA